MTTHVITGLIPFGVSRPDTGKFLTIGSIPGWIGQAAGCFNHWRDNQIVLRNPVTWVVSLNGLNITHVLDSSIPYERTILEWVKLGRMGFSYGWSENPAQQKTSDEWTPPDWWPATSSAPRPYTVEPVKSLFNIGHISYADIDKVAYEQAPAQLAGNS